ncbi:uncharacterized protein EKO05_0007742 [Ascochyta rabiei]|uniref:uncharacterized protein n=1 Tax=Didymella rabiei TaxID=5454 RepID=UPI002203360C|nr:uncharacterized protein EKO05_0007742 [Ascochyta rabiei]UPX17382.1 hypothetical protein EKO05_0007742 [Ascochyta rabiei]
MLRNLTSSVRQPGSGRSATPTYVLVLQPRTGVQRKQSALERSLIGVRSVPKASLFLVVHGCFDPPTLRMRATIARLVLKLGLIFMLRCTHPFSGYEERGRSTPDSTSLHTSTRFLDWDRQVTFEAMVASPPSGPFPVWFQTKSQCASSVSCALESCACFCRLLPRLTADKGRQR